MKRKKSLRLRPSHFTLLLNSDSSNLLLFSEGTRGKKEKMKRLDATLPWLRHKTKHKKREIITLKGDVEVQSQPSVISSVQGLINDAAAKEH